MKQQKTTKEIARNRMDTAMAAGCKLSVVTEADLRSGAVSRIKERTLCRILGVSLSKARKDRVDRKGVPYVKDENGSIFYKAIDVINYLDNALVHRSTSEYDTERYQLNLAKAREATKSLRESGDQVCA